MATREALVQSPITNFSKSVRRREHCGDLFIVTHVVDPSHDGLRADLFLCIQYPHLSRNKLQNFIDQGRVELVNRIEKGKKLKASTVLQSGDELRVISQKTEAEPEVNFNYKILYEDNDILVVDKPPNLPVHPAGRYLFNTLLMRLRQERPTWKGNGKDFYLIHRLDRETSGVLLLAKTFEAAGKLVHQFRTRKTEKRYFAVAYGHPEKEKFSIDFDLGRDLESMVRLKMRAFPKGEGPQSALTHFKIIKQGVSVTLLECELMTGRQHQIRVHLAAAGHAVVGDKLYGRDEKLFLRYADRVELTPEQKAELVTGRQALHSRYLKFFHDGLGKWMEIESPLPKDMEALLERSLSF